MSLYINYHNIFFLSTNRQTDRNFIDNKKSQLDLHVMCIHGIQQQKHKHTLTIV